jgi:hypothetical protein
VPLTYAPIDRPSCAIASLEFSWDVKTACSLTARFRRAQFVRPRSPDAIEDTNNTNHFLPQRTAQAIVDIAKAGP